MDEEDESLANSKEELNQVENEKSETFRFVNKCKKISLICYHLSLRILKLWIKIFENFQKVNIDLSLRILKLWIKIFENFQKVNID